MACYFKKTILCIAPFVCWSSSAFATPHPFSQLERRLPELEITTQLTDWNGRTTALTGLIDGIVHQYQSDGSWLKIDSGLPSIRDLVQRGDITIAKAGSSLWRRAEPSGAWQLVDFPGSSQIAALRAEGDFFWAWSAHLRAIPKIYRSSDGISWTEFFVNDASTPRPRNYHDLRWADGRYVLVGNTYQSQNGLFSHFGGLWTSTNGIDWQRENEVDDIYFGVAYRNGLWLAGGFGGNYATSQDGSTWTRQRHPFVSQYFTNGIDIGPPVYSNLRSVVASAGGFHAIADILGRETVVVSDDGLEWAASTNVLGTFRAGPNLFASSAGETWLWTGDGSAFKSEDWRWNAERVLPVEPTNWQVAMASSTEVVLLGEAGRVAYSTDGVDWDFFQVPGRAADPAAGMWNAQRREFAAIASSQGSGLMQFWRSTNGRNWGSRNLPISGKAVGMAYGNGRYVVATQQGSLLFSTNGLTWQATIPSFPPSSGSHIVINELADVMFDGEKFIALEARGHLLESTNGYAWFRRSGPFSQEHAHLNKIIFADGLYFCYGEAGAFFSEDGLVWNQAYANGTGQVIYAFEEWLQLTEKRLIFSSDTMNWRETPEPRPFGLNGNTLVVYQNRLIVAGDHGKILQSPIRVNDMDSWKTSYFDPASLADSAISGDAADPDADGMNNMLEYAFGMHPRLADAQAALRNRFLLYQVNATETKKVFQFSFPNSVESHGAKVWIEQSSDLENWSRVITRQDLLSGPDSIVNGRRLVAIESEVKADGSTPITWFRLAARRKE